MKTKLSAYCVGGAAVLFIWIAAPVVGGNAESATELGSETGKLVQAGFVFVDGRYVDAPYSVCRKGPVVYINSGSNVCYRVTWPPVDHAKIDPALPRGLTKESTFKDLDIPSRPGDSIARMKIRYVRRHHTRAEAEKILVDFYRKLPFVTNVVLSGPFLKVHTTRGSARLIDVFGGPVSRVPTAQEVGRRLSQWRSRYENVLKMRKCLLLFSNGAELSFASKKAEVFLPKLAEVAEADGSSSSKMERLQSFGIIPDGESMARTYEAIVTNFCVSAQFRERIKGFRVLSDAELRSRKPDPLKERQLIMELLKKRGQEKK